MASSTMDELWLANGNGGVSNPVSPTNGLQMKHESYGHSQSEISTYPSSTMEVTSPSFVWSCWSELSSSGERDGICRLNGDWESNLVWKRSLWVESMNSVNRGPYAEYKMCGNIFSRDETAFPTKCHKTCSAGVTSKESHAFPTCSIHCPKTQPEWKGLAIWPKPHNPNLRWGAHWRSALAPLRMAHSQGWICLRHCTNWFWTIIWSSQVNNAPNNPLEDNRWSDMGPLRQVHGHPVNWFPHPWRAVLNGLWRSTITEWIPPYLAKHPYSYSSIFNCLMWSSGQVGKIGKKSATTGGRSCFGRGRKLNFGMHGLESKHHQRSRLATQKCSKLRMQSVYQNPVAWHHCCKVCWTFGSFPDPETHSKMIPADRKKYAALNVSKSVRDRPSSNLRLSPKADHGWQEKPHVKTADPWWIEKICCRVLLSAISPSITCCVPSCFWNSTNGDRKSFRTLMHAPACSKPKLMTPMPEQSSTTSWNAETLGV